MRINVYEKDKEHTPLRIRKWVRTMQEAKNFCNWLAKETGISPNRIYYTITR